MKAPGKYRWKMMQAILKFLPAGGHTPELQENLQRVKFADVENFSGVLPPDAEATLTRFFRMKIQSVHFCGRAFHDATLLEGFHSLALLFPVLVWLARWLAVSAGRKKISNDDVQRAISMADYHHGFSTWLRWRVRLLAQRDDITRLCAWYGKAE
jgi:lysine-N-methylase